MSHICSAHTLKHQEKEAQNKQEHFEQKPKRARNRNGSMRAQNTEIGVRHSGGGIDMSGKNFLPGDS
jgi:hypothetical protein